MAAYIPVQEMSTTTISLMAHGFDPYLTQRSPFHGAMYNVILSCNRLIAAGADPDKIWLSLQEYFEALRNDPKRWGKPFAALLGAYKAQKEMGYAAIGGKDSMSGSFENIDVPPTLISFAVGLTDEKTLCSNELKQQDSYLVYLKTPHDNNLMPDFRQLKQHYRLMHKLIADGKIRSCSTVEQSGIAVNLCLRSFGNQIGFEIDHETEENLFECLPGSFLIECNEETKEILVKQGGRLIGKTNSSKGIHIGKQMTTLEEVLEKWMQPLEDIFPLEQQEQQDTQELIENKREVTSGPKRKINITLGHNPRIFIPVFPGTNCEYDTHRAFKKAGGECQVRIFKNLNADDIERSSEIFAQEISKSQILMIPGGFSAGDEPDGSGKFIAAVFRHKKIQKAVNELLEQRDGLILGICNGFQALLRLGLLPFGAYKQPEENLPTLTYNHIGRHISTIASTKVISVKSPWFSSDQLQKTFEIPLSHTEGRFYCNQTMLKQLENNEQIATCYCSNDGIIDPTSRSNPNGSIASIEGITSPDGRVLGKMAHNERVYQGLYKNIPGINIQDIFKNGVNYFRL